MSTPLQFRMTQAGLAACWNANHTGLSLDLTHIQFGSGHRVPDGLETTLVSPQDKAAIAAGFSVSPTQIRMTAIFTGNTSYPIREVGLWAGDPAMGGSVLVAYWSQAAGELAAKYAGVDFIFAHDMTLAGIIPEGSLTILADTGQSVLLAMLMAHDLDELAHPSLQAALDSLQTALNAQQAALTAHDANAFAHPALRARLEALEAKTASGTIPSGTRMLFAQVSAPVGWTQIDDAAIDDRMLRIVTGSGGGMGGTHSPILMNVVPTHSHTAGATVTITGGDHSHGSGTLAADAGDAMHNHQTGIEIYTGFTNLASTAFDGDTSPSVYGVRSNSNGEVSYSAAANHGHTVSGSTDSSAHTHEASAEVTVNANTGMDWTPRYFNIIVAQAN